MVLRYWFLVIAMMAASCSNPVGDGDTKAAADDTMMDGADALEEGEIAGTDIPGFPDIPESDPDASVEGDSCASQCEGLECGSDGCGGSCGECEEGDKCMNGFCVPDGAGCTSLEDCYPYICDEADGECVLCATDEECAEAEDVCDPDSGMCVECATNENCPEFHECQDGFCAQLECPASPCPEGLVCDEEAQECVECLQDSDCLPFHECIDAVCMPPTWCESSKDCADDEVCDKTNGVCVECTGDADCPEGFRCTAFKCEEILVCASDKDCKEYDKVCNKDIGECVDCLSDLDCTKDHHCVAQVCLPDVCDQETEWPACQNNNVSECNENGSVLTVLEECGEQEFCADAQCHPWVCLPEEVGCDGNVAYECNDMGSDFLVWDDCGDYQKACSNGACKEVPCQPGEAACVDPFTLVVCEDGDEVSFLPTPCGVGKFCDAELAECVDWVCSPGESLCDGQVAVDCNEFGSELMDPEDCGELDLVCVAGECVDCDPQCGAKDCGPDACGGECGTCQGGDACLAGYCTDVTCPESCTGKTAEAFICGIDLCYPDLVFQPEVAAPLGDPLGQMFDVAGNFGAEGNDLAPINAPSLAVFATGKLSSAQHNDAMPPDQCSDDLFTDAQACDVVQGSVKLTAPPGATGFSVDFVLLSQEYAADQKFNDKFYMVLNAPQTTGGADKVINYVECVNPEKYTAFEEGGTAFCYIAILADLHEPVQNHETDISGTNFPTSTGWMRTAWTIEPEEEFTILFHVQDTQDGLYDTAIVLDNFHWFYGDFQKGTAKL